MAVTAAYRRSRTHIIVRIVSLLAAGYAYTKVQGGSNALQGFSGAQDVELATTPMAS